MGHKNNLESKSKFLSQLLRHKPELLDLNMSSEGWVPIKELTNGGKFTKEEILKIVKEDKKGRYQVSVDSEKVRAVSGHSIPGIEPDLMVATEVPDILYHGTSSGGLRGIKESGEISRMSRNYIFLISTKEEAWNTGKRHGTPCILEVDTKQMISDGWVFWVPQGKRYFFSKENIPEKYIKNILWSYM